VKENPKGRRDKLTLNHWNGVDACTGSLRHASGLRRLLFPSYRARLLYSHSFQHELYWIPHSLRHRLMLVISERIRSLSKEILASPCKDIPRIDAIRAVNDSNVLIM
jgi:hypothetical protein